jgi:DNA helicase-2/ATP-dependent DNA helicase PcrA
LENDENEYFTFPEKEVKDRDLEDDWYNARYQHLCESYRKYLKLLEDENLIDYALLQTKALELLESNQNIVGELKYENILIDEFQDTDPVQMKIFEILMKDVETFTVVGDDEQSIYAFRGSSVRFFKDFEEKYNAHLIFLRTNYRSTESIVKFSENFIKQDRDSNSTKSIHANPSHEGPKNSLYHLYNQDKDDEAFHVVKLIKFLKESGKISNYSDVGILTRTISMGKIFSLTENLKKENISYDVVGNHDLLEKDEIKSILLLFYYLIENDENHYIMNKWEFQWLNISGFASDAFNSLKMINLSENTRHILLKLENEYKNKVLETEKEVYEELTGKKSRKRSFKGIFNRDEEVLIEIFKKVEKPALWKYNTQTLREFGIKDNNDLEFFNKLYNLRKELEKERKNENMKYRRVSTLLNVFYRLLDITGYLNIEFVEDEKNLEELGNLGIISHTLYNLENVITKTNLRTMFWYLYHNIENYDSKAIDQGDEVQIMTVHKSKGLEFPVIIVYGLQEDSFPSEFRDDENKLTGFMGMPQFPVPDEFAEYRENLSFEEKEKNNYLEERRVLYVAMTRAEDILVLSTRLDKSGNMVEIKGIDFNPTSIPKITNNFSILPKTQCKNMGKDDGEILPLSFTSLESYKNCPFKYHLKYNLSFAESDDIYIKKGNFVHILLNKIHKTSNNREINLDEILSQHTTKTDRIKNKKEIDNLQKYLKNSFKDIEVLESEFPLG